MGKTRRCRPPLTSLRFEGLLKILVVRDQGKARTKGGPREEGVSGAGSSPCGEENATLPKGARMR